MSVKDFFQNIFARAFSWLTGTDLTDTARRVDINRRGATVPISIIYGRDYVPEGVVVFEDTFGTDDKYLLLCVVLGEGEIEDIEEIFLDEKPLSDFNRVLVFEEDAGSWVGDDIVVIQKFYGTDTQPQSTLLNSSTKWAAKQRRLLGTAYLAIRLKGVAKYFQGPPQVSAVVKGKKVYDPRTTTTAWSDNGALVLRDLMRSDRYGRGLPESRLSTSWETAATACDGTDSFATNQNLGTPDDVVTMFGGRKYLKWNTKPAQAFSMEQITLQNTGATKVATAGIPFSTPGWNGFGAAFYIPFTMTTGADFTTSDTIFAGATSAKRLTANITLNGGQSRETIMRNVQKLLPACRGIMPTTGEKYELYVEGSQTAVGQITEDDVERGRGFNIRLPKKKTKVNRVLGKFRNPNTNWKEDIAIWPEPGSTEETNLLADDNGQVLEKEVKLDHVINKYVANDLSRLAGYKFRNDISFSHVGRASLLQYVVGDVVGYTLDGPGWNQKDFMIVAMGITRDGSAVLELVEHENAIYTYQQIDLDLLRDDTDLPDPFYVIPPTNLQLATIEDNLFRGGKRVGFSGTFDSNLDEDDVEVWEIQYKLSADADWIDAPAQEGRFFQILNLSLNATYDCRVRARNRTGIRSDWLTVSSFTLTADTTAPGLPTGITLTAGFRQLTVDFTPPADIDRSYVEVYYATSDSIPGSPQLTASYLFNKVIIPNLDDDTEYFVWLKSVDDTGNVSAATASVSETTLVSPTADYKIAETEPDAAAFAEGAYWYKQSTGEVKKNVAGVWVAFIPDAPTQLRLTNADPADATKFQSGIAKFDWQGEDAPFFWYDVELWWGGGTTPKRAVRSENRGGPAAARFFSHSYEDAIDADPDTSSGQPQIKDGARTFEVRVYTILPDLVTRSSTYATLTVSNDQMDQATGLAATVVDRSIEITHDFPEGQDFYGVEIHGSSSSGFTPSSGTLLRTVYAASGREEIRSLLSGAGTRYIKIGWFDVWGKDSITYSAQASAVLPSNFGGLAYLGSVGTGQIQNDAVTRSKVVAGELVKTHVVNDATGVSAGTGPIVSGTSVDLTSLYEFDVEATGLVTFKLTASIDIDEVLNDVWEDAPYVTANFVVYVNGVYNLINVIGYWPPPVTFHDSVNNEVNCNGSIVFMGTSDYTGFPSLTAGDTLLVEPRFFYQTPSGTSCDLFRITNVMLEIQEFNNS